MISLQPMNILKAGAEEEKAEVARMTAFIGALAVGDLVKTTLGPKGMDKILVSGDPNQPVHVTNDGATIMRAIGVDNAAARVLVDISKIQDEEVGDGTTSVVVLTCELLRGAESLIAQKLHPQTIISGWRKAAEVARTALVNSARAVRADDAAFKSILMKVARTTLSSKILKQDMEHFAELAVDAVLRLKGTGNLQSIQILKKLGGNLEDSFLDEGFLLDKKIGVNQPKRLENVKILVANTPMDTDKVKVFGSRVRVDAVSKVAELELAEKEKMKDKVDRICKHGCNVFINRQLIYNYPEQLFADNGVMAIEHADFEGVERLALVTGAEIVSTFDNPERVRLGSCKVIEEVMIGEETAIKFSGVKMGEACTIVIRGATQQIIDEADRSLHDALCVLVRVAADPKIIYGGGCTEMEMSVAVQELALKTPGKESVAIESFAKALAAMPGILADNAGYDSAELVSQLRAAHVEGKKTWGLNMTEGAVGCMEELGVVESLAVKHQAVMAATEAAEQLMRVDSIIKAQPRPRQPDHHPC